MAAKSKKKNKYIPLIVMCVLLCGLGIVYAVLSSANDKKEAEQAALEAEENEYTMIAEYDYTTTTALSFKMRGDEMLDFEVSGTSWVYSADEKFPLNQTIIANMAAAIAQIGVECTVDEGDPAEFGLDDPEYTIKVKYSDGTSHEYLIGDYNTFNSSYYFMADGDMYMISSGLLPYFTYELEDLLLLDTMPTSEWSDTSYVNHITVKYGERENTIEDADGISELVSLINSISLNDCADYYTEDDEKDAYGLDGSTTITVNYKKAKTSTDADGNESTVYLDTNYTFELGMADGEYYLMPPSSNITYSISAATAVDMLTYLSYTPEIEADTTETAAETLGE